MICMSAKVAKVAMPATLLLLAISMKASLRRSSNIRSRRLNAKSYHQLYTG